MVFATANSFGLKLLGIQACLCLALVLSTSGKASQSVTLAWDRSTGPDLAGYKLYYGPASRSFTNMINAGAATTATVPGLSGGTAYFFFVTAYNTSELESDPSTEITYRVPQGTPPPNTAPNISALSDRIVPRNGSTGLVPFTVSDLETPADALTLSAASWNPGVVPDNQIVFGGSGSNRTVTVTPAANASGTVGITIMVSDALLYRVQTFMLTVVPVDGPSINSQPVSQSTLAGATVRFDVAASGTEPLSYQWQHNGMNLLDGGNSSGARTSTLTLSNAQAGQSGTYQVVVTNVAGAVTSLVAALTVTNNQVIIAGTAWYYPPSGPSDKRAGDVTISFTGHTNLSAQTASDGSYSVSVLMGGDYSVTPNTPLHDSGVNGVTTMDMSLIRRHLLNAAPLDSPYKLLAADVNASRSVTTLDISLMRKFILGLTNQLPAGRWRFIPADYSFADPQNPWDAPNSRHYRGVVGDRLGEDFVAIQLGDVNNSWAQPSGTNSVPAVAEPPTGAGAAAEVIR